MNVRLSTFSVLSAAVQLFFDHRESPDSFFIHVVDYSIINSDSTVLLYYWSLDSQLTWIGEQRSSKSDCEFADGVRIAFRSAPLPSYNLSSFIMTSTSEPKSDLSAKIGGRIVNPAFPVVDDSGPTPLELSFDASLRAFTTEFVALETTEGIKRRERVLNRMGSLCRDWIKDVCIKRGLPPNVINSGNLNVRIRCFLLLVYC